MAGETTKACVESQVAKNGILYVSRGRLFAGQASTGNELTRTKSLGLYGLRNFQRYGEFDGIWKARPPGARDNEIPKKLTEQPQPYGAALLVSERKFSEYLI
jgi:hypothetical protein